MSEIKFACPNCRQHIACDDGYVGIGIECPSCGSSMHVPGAAFGRPIAASRMEPNAEIYSQPTLADKWSLPGRRATPSGFSGSSDTLRFTIQTYWLLFWSVLLAPAVVSLVALGILKLEAVWMSIVLSGSVLAGIICGIMLTRSMKVSVAARILIFIICAPVLALLSFGVCVIGCTVVGVAAMSKH